ncbi:MULTISPECIES: gamma-glutamylcyclotransferase family protein [Planktothrix]|uniref:Gamma-glutamylcyclotransferase n=1 Tax=Planktothrix mougeotii LEGE 06226 TaxID=1828728 RepID=A0ABR9UM88_9CYAN|nr:MULTISPECIES: gamma-glutamylcyclotransferase [Planktothrix]MBD2485895.1 gamma-glutamylcyclotransferase [Planktothrix sp. FACHB-1365]MBE9146911.1 gamma-glutamylcyclotransferase [Planktothrix mougeotii LEGE 06226]
MTNLIHVFVYGTLKPGESNYLRYCQGRVIAQRPAVVQGKLYDLSLGYPGLVAGDGIVQGVILSFSDPNIFIDLDQLEDYQPHRPPEENEYQRQQIPVFDLNHQPLGLVWAYLMDMTKVQVYSGVLIPDGCWKNRD